MRPNPFEYKENIIGLIFIVIGVLDACIAVAASDHTAEAWHTGLQSLLLGIAAGACVTLMLRWHREHHTMLEAMKLSEHIVQNNDIARNLRAIIEGYSKVCSKLEKWPPFSQAIVISELESFKVRKIEFLDRGSIHCDLTVGRRYSPSFFELYKGGKSFVTSYGEWEYWTKAAGVQQLDANRKAIEHKHGDIIRYFILRRSEERPSIDTLDRIILDQINAGIKVYMIEENDEGDVNPYFLRNVGVFFDEKDQVKLLSVWYEDEPGSSPENRNTAEISFERPGIEYGEKIYDYFLRHRRAENVYEKGLWEKYKTTYKARNGRGNHTR